MFSAQIDSEGKCFHITDSQLPKSPNVIPVDTYDVLGKIWDGEKWNDPPAPEPEPIPKPTQLDNIESTQLVIMEAMADQYEESLEKELNNMEVQATIYEAILELGGNV